MTTQLRTTVLSAVLVTALALACVVAGAGFADAAPLPRSVPMTAVFDGLHVGEPASKSWTIEIPKPALITDTSIRRDGDDSTFKWTASLCPTSGACVDLLSAPDGAELAAGTYRLGLGVTEVALGLEQSQSIEGSLTFVERPTGSLALTGSGSLVPFLLSAIAAMTVGALLFLVARRRRPAQETEDLR